MTSTSTPRYQKHGNARDLGHHARLFAGRLDRDEAAALGARPTGAVLEVKLRRDAAEEAPAAPESPASSWGTFSDKTLKRWA